MTKKSNPDELMAALETIREKEFSDVPRELLEAILNIEVSHQDNRTECQDKIFKLLDSIQ
jgi:tartrate dehydratase alpha subunit/fumarate hydratase class I-like protein